MYIVLAGGGKIGYYLCKTLLQYNHTLAVIEAKAETCKKLANELYIPVVMGDCTNIDNLAAVNVGRADIFIAVTGKDEDNLISCQLVKRNFGIKRTISRVNNPKNITVFEKLGVDIPVSSTSIIADLIEQEVDYSGMKTLMKLKGGKIVLSEIMITEKSPINNKTLKDIELPKNAIITSIIRDEEVIIPNGFTAIHTGDYIIIVTNQYDQQRLKAYFLGE